MIFFTKNFFQSDKIKKNTHKKKPLYLDLCISQLSPLLKSMNSQRPIHNYFSSVNKSQNQIQQVPRQRQSIEIPQFHKNLEGVSLLRQPNFSLTHLLRSGYIKILPHYFRNLESQYELQELDLEFLNKYNNQRETQILPIDMERMVQQKEIQRHYSKYVAFKPGEGIDPGRSFRNQWDLLKQNQQEIPIEIESYLDEKTEQLGRPLLRVFMRALPNDPSAHMAFRPSQVYKQRRLKRVGYSLDELESFEKRLRIENQMGLLTTKMIIQRERVKYDQILVQKLMFLQESLDENQSDNENLDYKSLQNINDLSSQAEQLKQKINQKETLPKPPTPIKTLEINVTECQILECSFKILEPFIIISNELVEMMDDQYVQMQNKKIDWPHNILVIRDKEFDNTNTLKVQQKDLRGIFIKNNTIIIGDEKTTLLVQRCHDPHRVKINYIDIHIKRMSVAEGLRVQYEHFLLHANQFINHTKQAIDTIRRGMKRKRNELLRQKILLQKKKQREELLKQRKSLMKFTLKWKDVVGNKVEQPIKKIYPKEDQIPIDEVKSINLQDSQYYEQPNISDFQQFSPPSKVSAMESTNKIVLHKYDTPQDELKLSEVAPLKFRIQKYQPQIFSPSIKIHLGTTKIDSYQLDQQINSFQAPASKQRYNTMGNNL